MQSPKTFYFNFCSFLQSYLSPISAVSGLAIGSGEQRGMEVTVEELFHAHSVLKHCLNTAFIIKTPC